MAITTKKVDLTKEDLSAQQWASSQKGVWMNLLNGIYWNEKTNKFHVAPIKYSDTSLEGETLRFSGGQDFTVICSVLANEFEHKQEVKDKWFGALEKLKADYIEQNKLEDHIKSHNTDLKKLRKEGKLNEE